MGRRRWTEIRPRFLGRLLAILLLAAHGALVAGCDQIESGWDRMRGRAEAEVQAPDRDTQGPSVSVSEPIRPEHVEGYSTREPTLDLTGSAGDDRAVVRVKWESDRGGQGIADVRPEPFGLHWEARGIHLEPGDNRITITAWDAAANTGSVVLWVIRTTEVDFISYPDLSETVLMTDQPEEVLIRIGIQEAKGVMIDRVEVVRVNEGNEAIETIAELFDDGKKEHSDSIPKDAVFSNKTTLRETVEGRARFRIAVSGGREGAGSFRAYSEVFGPQVYVPWTEEQWARSWEIEGQAGTMYEKLRVEAGDEEAARQVAEWLKKQPNVVEASSSGDTYSYLLDSGRHGFCGGSFKTKVGPVRVNCAPKPAPEPPAAPAPPKPDEKRRPDPIRYKRQPARSSERAALTNPKVLVASAFRDQGDRLPAAAYDEVHSMIEGHKCPVFEAHRVYNQDAGIDTLKTMKDYDIVVLDTHGDAYCGKPGNMKVCPSDPDPADVVVSIALSGTPKSPDRETQYASEILGGKVISLPQLTYYAISPGFAASYGPSRPNSLVFNGSCRSYYGGSLPNGFINAGTTGYLGYSEVVSTCYDGPVVRSVFGEFLKGSKLGEVYDFVTRTIGPTDAVCSPEPEPHPATLLVAGDTSVTITADGFNNASFEDGTAGGWDPEGDVQVVTRVGSLTSKDGRYMAFVSTGEKAADGATSRLSQPFCVSPGSTKLVFDYRLVSEEPLEFVGSPYRDTFEASLDVAGAKTTLTSITTDGGSWAPVMGLDLEGGDHTVFATEWTTVSAPLPEAARNQGATLIFEVKDGGDRVYDTVVLIDAVRLES